MSSKEGVEAKNREQVALSPLPAVPHASILLPCSSSGCSGLDHWRTTYVVLTAIWDSKPSTEPEGGEEEKGEEDSLFSIPHFLSWEDSHVRRQEEGGWLSFFQPWACCVCRQKIPVATSAILSLAERMTISHFHFYELTTCYTNFCPPVMMWCMVSIWTAHIPNPWTTFLTVFHLPPTAPLTSQHKEAEQQENSRALEMERNIWKPHKDCGKRINLGRRFKTTEEGQGLIVVEDFR